MSHVDEGTLHAYFDGELPPSERRDLELHIAQCATCSARLGEERALFERAGALLGVTRPADRPAPPFERVRRAPKRPWYVRTTVAWAASLVLALGVGYLIRGSSARLAAPAVSDQRLVAAPETGAGAPEPQPSASERDQFTPTRPSNTERERMARGNEVAQVQGLARTDSLLGFSTAPPPVQLRGEQPAAAAADARALDSMLGRRDAAAAAVALEEAVVTTPPPARAERRAAAAAAPSANRNDARSVGVLSTTWPLISRGKAASLLGDRPVGVPGLATRSIRHKGDSTVVVEQALDSNTVIQIIQRPAHALEQVERERADGVLARYVGRLRVEIAGPVSTDSLNKLLEQLEPIP